MSDGKMDMRPDQVRQAAHAVDAVADRLAAAKSALDARLAETDGSWGNDDAGRDFANDHVPATLTSGENDQAAIAALRSFATALAESADGAEHRDETNADSLRTQA